MKESIEKELIEKLIRNVDELKKVVTDLRNKPPLAPEWVPRSQVMEFFSYGDTQMGALEKSNGLVMSKIGNRKFFHRDSIIKLLENNIINC